MVARAFIAQRTIDQDEVWCRPIVGYLTGGRDADQQVATGREELLGYKHSKGGTYRTTDHPDLADIVDFKDYQLSVIAGPTLMNAPRTPLLKVPHHVAVRVQHAGCGDAGKR